MPPHFQGFSQKIYKSIFIVYGLNDPYYLTFRNHRYNPITGVLYLLNLSEAEGENFAQNICAI